MAFTDSEGNVFETNAYGRPQGFWKNNKYVFPKFGNQPAAAAPVIVEPQAAMQPQQNNFRLPSTTANMRQENSEGLGEGDFSTDPANLNIDQFSLGNSPALGAVAGSIAGRALGPVGSLFGGAIGGKLGGRGNRGIGGDMAGTLLGTALLGPIGGLIGVAGGRMGDLHDMEDGLAFNKSKQSGLLDTLGYGFGFGDDMADRMNNYYNSTPAWMNYEASQPNALPATPPSMLEDIIAGSNVDPFDAIASMFSVESFDDGTFSGNDGGYSNPDDGEGMGGMGGFGGGYT